MVQYFTPTPAAWSDCRQSQVNNIFKSALFLFHDVFCFLFSHLLVFVYFCIIVLFCFFVVVVVVVVFFLASLLLWLEREKNNA